MIDPIGSDLLSAFLAGAALEQVVGVQYFEPVEVNILHLSSWLPLLF